MNKLKNCLPSAVALFCLAYHSNACSEQDLMSMSIEELLNVEVTSVSKKARALNDSPAAIFVINQEDIKRIGATSIPEALRLAPGLDVSRIDANKWAVTARGFNGRFANKLLVLIDGRSIYTRAFAGVYWENQDVMLEDVERIEVIRGPGATLWGANAVNGVINIITKHSKDTQGGLLAAGFGTQEQGFGAFRYGGEILPGTTARAYIKGFRSGENTLHSDEDAGDSWNKVQGGFRSDSQLTQKDSLTIQGDAYHDNINQSATFPSISEPYQLQLNERVDAFGGNIITRFNHVFSTSSDYTLQFFYDFYQREEFFLKESRHTLDIDFQHHYNFQKNHEVIWGMGYRYQHDTYENNSIVTINRLNRNDQLFNAFLQDEISLLDNLWLTLGSKFEFNDYSGFEVQPSARILWAPNNQHRLWGGVSYAARTPSRFEHDFNILQAHIPSQSQSIPSVAVIGKGNEDFESEYVVSYEIGYRTTRIKDVSIDLTAFYNAYKNIRSVNIGIPGFNGVYLEQPVVIGNDFKVKTYGFELSSIWQMLEWWRWDVSYSLLKSDYSQDSLQYIGASPQQSVSVRGVVSPWNNVDLDILFRYTGVNKAVGSFGIESIDDYVSLDIRLAWKAFDGIELSLVGQNLLEESHLEYRQEFITSPTEIDRGVYGKISWQF